MKSFLFFTTIFFCSYIAAFAKEKPKNNNVNKGKFYLYWGWNRSIYSVSDIHFKGVDYDFILSKVVAKDRQSRFSIPLYFNPTTVTIPQYNNRFGYYINEHYSISMGEDHMKYVMKTNQVVQINGTINMQDSTFNKNYKNEDIKLTSNFLQFEHTDGLNYINTEFRRIDEIYNLKKLTSLNIAVSFTEGIGVGILYPRTNTTLLGKPRYDEFHLAGYGVSAVIGLGVNFGKHFFIQSEFKGGYINMPDIRTTMDEADKASQHFIFLQRNVVFGWSFRINKK